MTTSSLQPPGERVLPARPGWPDETGHFGVFGGRFVPEALIAALDELTEAYEAMRVDPAFLPEFDSLQRHYTGRPSPITEVARFAEHCGGARVLLKREDLNHTGAHKIRNVLGQALLTRRMGKTRVIAETGAGQHGVASATAAAWFDLDCTVYMGAVDTRRQALNVARMRLLGAEVVPVKSGSRTLKDAINEGLRDWVANVDSTHYLMGTVAGPHPFPEMVRDFHRAIGEGTGNPQFVRLLGILEAYLRDAMTVTKGYESQRADFVAQSRREHHAIANAIAARDPKAARAAAIEHHLNGERRLIISGAIKPSRVKSRR